MLVAVATKLRASMSGAIGLRSHLSKQPDATLAPPTPGW